MTADPLLEALLQVARLHDRACSRQAITAGLPLVNDCLTPELMPRAAERAGLNCKVVARSVEQIQPVVLPAIVLLADNQALVLTAIDHQNNEATLLDQDTHGQVVWSVPQLQAVYSGYVILLKPAFRFDRRVQPSSTTDSHWFWGVIAGSWRSYRDVLLASFLVNVLALASPLFVMNVYDRVVPNETLETLWVLAIGVIVVALFDLILKSLRHHLLESAGRKSDVLLSGFVWERVLGARLSEKARSVGAFASQLREFDTLRTFLTSAAMTTLVDLPFALIFLLVIGYVGGWLMLPVLIGAGLILAVGLSVRKPLQQAVEKTYQASAQKNATLVETLSSLEIIKALGSEGRMQRLWELSVGNLAGWGQKARRLANISSLFSGLVMQLVTVAVVIVGVYLIIERELTMGALIACVLLSSRALAPVAQAAGLLVNFQQTRTAYESLEKVVNKTQERTQERRFVQRPQVQGHIRFDKVTFAYPDEQQPSLQQVSFSIAAGEKVAIIGRIGSGKTTLQKLILGLYTPQQGAVYVDNIDVQQLDPADLRAAIGYVPQEVSLFYGSVKDNIAFGVPHATDLDIVAAADAAGVTEFINQHPLGFERPVGERGENLSGGQRQSIAVARALLGHKAVYMMDEPSTGMDHSTEERLKQKLADVVADKTLVLVTHKATLMSLVDRVIVMDGGRLIADGPKATVLEALKKGQLRVG